VKLDLKEKIVVYNTVQIIVLNNGVCENNLCVCKNGFSGLDCSIKKCPDDCHGNGDCRDGMCHCRSGFFRS
jgi:hypothetical protein